MSIEEVDEFSVILRFKNIGKNENFGLILYWTQEFTLADCISILYNGFRNDK